MPNWVVNRLEFKGPNARGIMMSLFTCTNKGNPIDFDFNKIIPMPEELQLESSTRLIDGIRLYMLNINPNVWYFGAIKDKVNLDEYLELENKVKYFEHENKEKYIINDEKQCKSLIKTYESKTKEMICLGKKGLKNLIKYGTTDWYLWSIKNWGCKWNASETTISKNGNVVEFMTPWCPCLPVIKKIASIFKGIRIEYSFAEEQPGYYSGKYVFNNGSIIEMDEYDEFSKDAYDTYFDLWGFDDAFVFDEKRNTYVFQGCM